MDPKILDLSELSDHPSEMSEDDKIIEQKEEADKPNKKQYKLFNDLYLLNKTRFYIVEQAVAELQQLSQNQTSMSKDTKQIDLRRKQAIQTGNDTLQQINSTLKDCTQLLQKMKDQEEKLWQIKPEIYGTYSLEYRLCLEQCNSMQKTFISICQTFSDASGSAKAAIEGRIKRLLKLISNDQINEDKIDKVIENGDMECISRLVVSTKNEYDQILNEATEKNLTCQQINRTIEEIRQMTLNEAVMIQQQSEQIDRIQECVELAREDVQKGVKNLVKANQSAKAHKKCICCSICLTAIIAVIILIVIVSIISSKS